MHIHWSGHERSSEAIPHSGPTELSRVTSQIMRGSSQNPEVFSLSIYEDTRNSMGLFVCSRETVAWGRVSSGDPGSIPGATLFIGPNSLGLHFSTYPGEQIPLTCVPPPPFFLDLNKKKTSSPSECLTRRRNPEQPVFASDPALELARELATFNKYDDDQIISPALMVVYGCESLFRGNDHALRGLKLFEYKFSFLTWSAGHLQLVHSGPQINGAPVYTGGLDRECLRVIGGRCRTEMMRHGVGQ
ncbi:hypothetical protein C8F04DRAFT_1182082 [Mycena alexandri]|uniref:Uncharacterized protein n=1 Tax=Mycena alexandri TaxID=1745969 RepID=A0AAD6SXV3_9AGAR|nr:hypothetical protein C8F04DRAFT_1182082 [Mycena alexandri]